MPLIEDTLDSSQIYCLLKYLYMEMHRCRAELTQCLNQYGDKYPEDTINTLTRYFGQVHSAPRPKKTTLTPMVTHPVLDYLNVR